MKAYVLVPFYTHIHPLIHPQWRARRRFRWCGRLLRPLHVRRGTACARGHHEEDSRLRKLLQRRGSSRGQPLLEGAITGGEMYNMDGAWHERFIERWNDNASAE
jgi:hypothetical protein